MRGEMFLLILVVSLATLVRSQCQVEYNPENVVGTQLEGSWIPDSAMNSWLSPTISADLDIKEFKYPIDTIRFYFIKYLLQGFTRMRVSRSLKGFVTL